MAIHSLRLSGLILWFFAASCLETTILGAETGTETKEKQYSIHMSITEKLGIAYADEESGGYGIGSERTLFRFEDSRGNLVLAARQGANADPALSGGCILSSGGAWLGAGPGSPSGALAGLSEIYPSASISPASLPFSISQALDSRTFIFGFGTAGFAVLSARKTSGEYPFESATILASSAGRPSGAAASVSAIAAGPRFPLLGWKPGEFSDPASLVFRLAGGFSYLRGGWRLELRSAASAGRVVAPGAGFGAAFEYSGEGLTAKGGVAFSSAELRDPEARRAKRVAELKAALAYRWTRGASLAFRTEMGIPSGNSSSSIASEDEEDDFGDDEDDGQSPADSPLWLDMIAGMTRGLAFSGGFSLRVPLGRAIGAKAEYLASLDMAASGSGELALKHLRAELGFSPIASRGAERKSGWHATLALKSGTPTNPADAASLAASGRGGFSIQAPFPRLRAGMRNWELSTDLSMSAPFEASRFPLPSGTASVILDSTMRIDMAGGESLALGIRIKKTFPASEGANEAAAGIAPSLTLFLRGTVETGR